MVSVFRYYDDLIQMFKTFSMTQEIILKLLKKIRISKTERRDKISGGLMMVHK